MVKVTMHHKVTVESLRRALDLFNGDAAIVIQFPEDSQAPCSVREVMQDQDAVNENYVLICCGA